MTATAPPIIPPAPAAMPASIAPAHGSTVTYYLPDGNAKGQPRVALVAYAHGLAADSVLDLWVFANPRSDGLKYASALFVPGVQSGKLPGQWS